MKHLIQRPASRRRCTLASSITHILTGGTLLLVGAVASTSAFAQEKATNLDRITVTGSNIPRTNTETPSPVQVVTRQEIDRTGKTTVAEYLQTITANGAGSIPKSFGNGFAGGGAGISLRGLGAGSTLVLLNGRRMATYGLADDGQKVFTDLSTIPLDAVERVEVLKDGASAIYGSDAIAGVVNIILRSDFQGAILRGSYGVSGDGDGDTRKATLTAGTGDMATDGWNAFFSLDVGKSDAIKISDRKNRKWIGTGDTRQWGYGNNAQFLGGAFLSGRTRGGVGPNGSVYDDRNVTETNPATLVPLPDHHWWPDRCFGGRAGLPVGSGAAVPRHFARREVRQRVRTCQLRLRRGRRDLHRDRLLEEGDHLQQHAVRCFRRLGLSGWPSQRQQRRRCRGARPESS